MNEPVLFVVAITVKRAEPCTTRCCHVDNVGALLGYVISLEGSVGWWTEDVCC